MASAKIVITLLLCLSLCMWAHAASTPAPAPVDCTSALTGLIDCLSYVEAGTNVTRPQASCCAGIKGVVKNQAAVKCLCDAFGHDYGVKLNLTRAFMLPSACGSSADVFSTCGINVHGAPSEAPTAGGPSTNPAASPGHAAAATQTPVTGSILLASLGVALLAYYFM